MFLVGVAAGRKSLCSGGRGGLTCGFRLTVGAFDIMR
jgi:hypothetical protein